MKQMRRGLLMILIMALVIPSPAVMAESENIVVDNTTEAVEVVQPALEAPLAAEVLPAEPVVAQDATVSTTQPESATLPIHTPAISTDPQSNPPTTVSNTETNHSPVQSSSSDGSLLNTTANIVISKIRTSPTAEKYVELYNPTSQSVNLLGWKLEYISNSGKLTTLKNFTADHIIRSGGFMVISGKDDEINSFEKNVTITQVLAKGGGAVRLLRPGDEASESDVIGWGTEAKWREKQSTQASVNQLWRCFVGDSIVDSDDNLADISNEDVDGNGMLVQPGIKANCPVPNDQPEPDTPSPNDTQPPVIINKCEGLRLSEIAANSDEQFVELVNSSHTTLDISGCKLMTNRNKKEYVFRDMELAAGELLAVKIHETSLTLTKIGRGAVYVMDSSNNEIDNFDYAPMTKSTSMIFRDGEWLQTYSTTPGESNVFKEFPDCKDGYVRDSLTHRCHKIEIPKIPKVCPVGQYLNPETGRCKKIEVAKAPAPCKEGYYRSEETGRCRSITATVAKALKPCRDDEFRNPATGRCKKIAAASDILKECPEGFERNPATKRCRKIKSNIIPAVNFAPEKVQQVASATWGWWVFGGVSLLAISIAGWQWRWEISRATRKITSVFTKQRR